MSSAFKILLISIIVVGAFYKREQIEAALAPYLNRSEPALTPPGALLPDPATLVAARPPPPPVSPPETPAPAPAPIVSQAPPAPPPVPVPADELPENTYVLLERVPIVTDAGVRGVAAGTEVERVGEKDGQWIVRDSKGEFAVHPDKLTKNPKDIVIDQPPAAPAPAVVDAAEEGLVLMETGDPYEDIRKMHIDSIADIRLSLSREYASLASFKRAYPDHIPPGTKGSMENAIYLKARSRMEEKLRSHQAKLRALPPAPKS